MQVLLFLPCEKLGIQINYINVKYNGDNKPDKAPGI